jgi:hypothetical protein
MMATDLPASSQMNNFKALKPFLYEQKENKAA